MRFQFQLTEGAWVLIPTIVLVRGECACCGERGGWGLEFSFLDVSVTLGFVPDSHEH